MSLPRSTKFSTRLTPEEEQKIVDHVKWWAAIGYGVKWSMLQLLLHEILLAVTKVNPEQKTGLENYGQLPSMSWVRRFAERHDLVVCCTLSISKVHQIVSPEDIVLWQQDTYGFFTFKPDLVIAIIYLSIFLG